MTNFCEIFFATWGDNSWLSKLKELQKTKKTVISVKKSLTGFVCQSPSVRFVNTLSRWVRRTWSIIRMQRPCTTWSSSVLSATSTSQASHFSFGCEYWQWMNDSSLIDWCIYPGYHFHTLCMCIAYSETSGFWLSIQTWCCLTWFRHGVGWLLRHVIVFTCTVNDFIHFIIIQRLLVLVDYTDMSLCL